MEELDELDEVEEIEDLTKLEELEELVVPEELPEDGPPTVKRSRAGFGSARRPDSLSAPSGVTSS